MPKARRYTDADVTSAVKQSKSIAGVCRQIGLVPIGGNYKTIGKTINRLDLDVKHFTGQGWNIGNYKPVSSHKSREHLKAGLVRDRGHKCEGCGLTKWIGKSIPLELEHSDGDSSNDNPENTKLLCPNCHAFTPTYRRTKRSLVPKEGFEPTLPSS